MLVDWQRLKAKVDCGADFEPLAVAVDQKGPPDTDFMAALKSIVDAMHADGTLTQLSMKWFKADLTQGP